METDKQPYPAMSPSGRRDVGKIPKEGKKPSTRGGNNNPPSENEQPVHKKKRKRSAPAPETSRPGPISKSISKRTPCATPVYRSSDEDSDVSFISIASQKEREGTLPKT